MFLAMRSTAELANISTKMMVKWGLSDVKIPSYYYRNYHYNNKMVSQLSDPIKIEIPILGKTVIIVTWGPGVVKPAELGGQHYKYGQLPLPLMSQWIRLVLDSLLEHCSVANTHHSDPGKSQLFSGYDFSSFLWHTIWMMHVMSAKAVALVMSIVAVG